MSTAFAGRRPVIPARHTVIGGAVVERLMGARAVVEYDPGCNPGSRRAAVGIALEVDLLVLQRSPQPLDEDIVQPAPAAVHRALHAGSL